MVPIEVMVACYVGLMKGWWYYRFGVFLLCQYELRIYVLSYELTIGGPMPFIVKLYFILSKKRGEEKEKNYV